MTRTFLKGTPSSEQTKLISSVKKAHSLALKTLKNKIKAHIPYQAAAEHFEQQGFKTQQINGTTQGFIHSAGHGLGLDIHEPIHIDSNSLDILKTGMVITIEPGLYYPKIGGVRIEDVAIIENNGFSLLSKFHYKWHIK